LQTRPLDEERQDLRAIPGKPNRKDWLKPYFGCDSPCFSPICAEWMNAVLKPVGGYIVEWSRITIKFQIALIMHRRKPAG
jgi:hypothetical protein